VRQPLASKDMNTEAGSSDKGTVREPRGSRYKTTTGEDTAERKLSACCSEL
jgi:hypothetical protein